MPQKPQRLIKIDLPGGVISAGDFYEMLIIAKKAGAADIRFGNRQQLYFNIADGCLEDLELDMLSAEISYEIDTDHHPNIISSYIADTIFSHESWVKEGVYKDIFDLFNFKPCLKINIVDSNQTFVPFFTGNLNFIAADTSNYWYLYIRFPKTNTLYCWPCLIYSEDIPGISKVIEEVIFTNKQLFYDQPEIDGKQLYQLVNKKNEFVIQQYQQALKIPEFHLPYYEGFNRHGSKYWLGIYRRDELFGMDFLMDICTLCMQTRVGQLYISPWKSLLIKSIELADRGSWGVLLNKYRINVRHASNELNWQIEDLCHQCLNLKKELVRDFEEADLRTYRLSFAIKRTPKSGLFGSVMIRMLKGEKFEIIHTRDFNANTKEFVIYKQDVKRAELSGHLITLCAVYYASQSDENEQGQANDFDTDDTTVINQVRQVHQCKSCLTVYDELYGDEASGIAINTIFEAIDNYYCPVCDAPKQNFIRVDKNW